MLYNYLKNFEIGFKFLNISKLENYWFQLFKKWTIEFNYFKNFLKSTIFIKIGGFLASYLIFSKNIYLWLYTKIKS
jgi:hypothetical protein